MAADDDGGGRSLVDEQQVMFSNWSADDGRESDVLHHQPALRASVVTVYVVVIVFGVLGNGLVVVVAASRVPRPSPASRNSLQVSRLPLRALVVQ